MNRGIGRMKLLCSKKRQLNLGSRLPSMYVMTSGVTLIEALKKKSNPFA